MRKQDKVLEELLAEGYKLIKTEIVTMNGKRRYKTYVLESPAPESKIVTINFRGTINSKKSLTI